MDAHQHPHHKRNGEGQHTEHQRPAPVLLQVLQVHFQTGKEHDVVDTHLSEQLETAVALQDVETVLTDNHTGQNHADDVGDTQAAQQDRGKEDDHQHQEENPGGIRHGKVYADIHVSKNLRFYQNIYKNTKKVSFL